MRLADIARRRMYNQRLWGSKFENPEATAGGLCAMQAQEYRYAK